MTKYSDFVKSYMAKHGKTWNCAVCEIKKSGAYEKFKKGDTDKKEDAPVKYVPVKYVRKPLPFTVGDIARRVYEAEQRDLLASQVKTIAPSPIPAAAPLVEKPVIRQPTAPLVMPDSYTNGPRKCSFCGQCADVETVDDRSSSVSSAGSDLLSCLDWFNFDLHERF